MVVKLRCHNSRFNYVQGFFMIQILNRGDWSIGIRNSLNLEVKDIRSYRLILDTLYQLDLHDTFFVPSLSWNLISFSRLDIDGSTFSFCNQASIIYKNSMLVGSGFLYDGL